MSTLKILFIVLLILKLTNLATISWWWVFAPLIIEFVLVLIFTAYAEHRKKNWWKYL